jgi:hypothetical protein
LNGSEEAEGDIFPKNKFHRDFCFVLGHDVTINNTWKQLAGLGSCLTDLQFYKNVKNVKAVCNPATDVCARCGHLAKFRGSTLGGSLGKRHALIKTDMFF